MNSERQIQAEKLALWGLHMSSTSSQELPLFPPLWANLVISLAICPQKAVQLLNPCCGGVRSRERHAGSGQKALLASCPSCSHPAVDFAFAILFTSAHGEAGPSGAMLDVGKHLWGESLNVRHAFAQKNEFLAAIQANKKRQSHTTFWWMKTLFYL